MCSIFKGWSRRLGTRSDSDSDSGHIFWVLRFSVRGHIRIFLFFGSVFKKILRTGNYPNTHWLCFESSTFYPKYSKCTRNNKKST